MSATRTPRAPKDPYAVTLSDDQRREVTDLLCDTIRNAKIARDVHMSDGGLIDWYYSLYEQESQKGISRDAHRYGQADLTSPIGTENVDALASRAAKTIFTSPLWIVEGDQASAKKAPLVEEVMQWRQEEMRLQKTAKRVFLSALVETGSVFEACEDVEPFQRTVVVRAQLQPSEDGGLLLDADGTPVPLTDADGAPVPCEHPESEPYVEVKHVYTDYRRRGASVRRRSMKDFVFLPSHAEDDAEVWGHAHRFFPRLSDLKRREQAGEIDHVDDLAAVQQRDQRTEHDRSGVTVQVDHATEDVELEVWRVQFWYDLGQGYTCYRAWVSEIDRVVLMLKVDWLTKWRTIYVNPYPCPYSVYGYSMVGTKLGTTILEHTAWRNMNADRGTLKSNAPLKRLRGALWDPRTQPFEAGAVIDVSNMNEVAPFEFEDVSQHAILKEQQCVSDAQRQIGLNDIAIGQQSAQSRTLGENRLATQSSFVRTDDPIGNIQEAMEELGAVIHAIEVQALRDREDGMAMPAKVAESIQLRSDPSFNGTITAEMIDGRYQFKPRGSSEDADPNRRQQVMVNMVNTIMNFGKAIPAFQQRMTDPEFASAIMQMIVDEFKPRDRQAFLKPLAPPPMLPAGGSPILGAPGAAPPSFGGDALIASMTSALGHGAMQ